MMRRFGEYARHARVQKRVSLRTVAEALDLSIVYISDIERGNRNPPAEDKLRVWARVLGEDAQEFIRRAELDREVVELPVRRDPKKAELALMFARCWEDLTEEDEQDLMAWIQERRHG